jgi:hypothetical protein
MLPVLLAAAISGCKAYAAPAALFPYGPAPAGVEPSSWHRKMIQEAGYSGVVTLVFRIPDKISRRPGAPMKVTIWVQAQDLQNRRLRADRFVIGTDHPEIKERKRMNGLLIFRIQDRITGEFWDITYKESGTPPVLLPHSMRGTFVHSPASFKEKRTDQSTESRAFGTSGISAAEQPRMPEASGMR